MEFGGEILAEGGLAVLGKHQEECFLEPEILNDGE